MTCDRAIDLGGYTTDCLNGVLERTILRNCEHLSRIEANWRSVFDVFECVKEKEVAQYIGEEGCIKSKDRRVNLMEKNQH